MRFLCLEEGCGFSRHAFFSYQLRRRQKELFQWVFVGLPFWYSLFFTPLVNWLIWLNICSSINTYCPPKIEWFNASIIQVPVSQLVYESFNLVGWFVPTWTKNRVNDPVIFQKANYQLPTFKTCHATTPRWKFAKPFRWLAKMQPMEIFAVRSAIGVLPVDAKAVRRTFDIYSPGK